MFEYFLSLDTEMVSSGGFLGTRASFYIDTIVIFLAILPFVIALSIFFAINGRFKLHKFIQTLFFILTLISLALFAYIVHYKEGLETLLLQSSMMQLEALIFLGLHAFLAIITLIVWMFTLIYASEDRKRRALPGLYSENHKKLGRALFLGILFTSLSGIGIYWILFVI